MVDLGQSELRDVIDAAARIGAASDLGELGTVAVEVFGSLVGADLTSYNEVGGGRGPVVIASGAEPTPEETGAMGRLIHQNPILGHFAATGDGQALRISDFIGDRELRGLALHRELYAGIGVNFQMAISMAAADGRVIGVALSRERRDFADTEVASLELLRTHLASSHRRLTEIAWQRQVLAALDAETGAIAVLSAQRDGRILRANPAARALLGEDATSLPADLLAGARQALGAAKAVAFSHRGVTLSARISAAEVGEGIVISLRPAAAESLRLAALANGLSPREAEVIGCLGGGASAPDLALRLGISRRTIEKHLGNAYRKLGVGGRSEAMALILASGAPIGVLPSPGSGPAA